MKVDIIEFEFNNKVFFASRQEVGESGRYRKIWTENSIKYPDKMKLRFKDIGANRWLCYAQLTKENAYEFESWLKESLGDRYILNKEYDYKDGELIRTFIIRGGDVRDKTLILLRWK